ncbi:MAG TPA: response regulator [Aggregatilineales bacterium]|nr:response regulator [Aggregatilineales bacterium]
MKQILVIDDDVLNLEAIVELLQFNGYDVVAADSGEEGVQLARKIHPDVIMCDILMTPISGFDVIQILSQDAETASIPVIIVSALTEPSNIHRGLELGAVEYLRKPYEHEELLATLRQKA